MNSRGRIPALAFLPIIALLSVPIPEQLIPRYRPESDPDDDRWISPPMPRHDPDDDPIPTHSEAPHTFVIDGATTKDPAEHFGMRPPPDNFYRSPNAPIIVRPMPEWKGKSKGTRRQRKARRDVRDRQG